MAWWVWLVAGLGLLGAEVVTPGGFVLMFFGLGAVAAGLTACLLDSAALQAVVFAVVSAGSLAVFRRRMLEGFRAPPMLQDRLVDVVGGAVVLTEDAPAHGRGRAEFRGAPWAVLNTGTEPLRKGDRARILGVDGLTLQVSKE